MADYGDANPFADPEAANPFEDPSVKQARGQRQAGMDDYNPFADGGTKPAAAQQPQVPAPQRPQPATTQPAVMQPSEPPAYTPTPAQSVSTDDLQKRQEELERKAAELARKEQEMRSMQYDARANNWPPLPKWCCVGPCFYQDFNVDIPLEFQRIVKLLYYLWMFHACVLVLNVLGSLAYFISKSKDPSANSSGAGVTFGLSILFFILFTPCSFICWYRPVYKAFRSDSSFNFFVFFFVFFIQFVAHIIECLGIDSAGSVGIISALSIVSLDPATGAIMFVVGILFALMGLFDIILLIKVHRIYRSTGASLAKARQEFATGVMKNETVQGVAANAGAAAARGAFAAGTENRY
ncbi:secretory carrier-associated membrane protein 1 isoform X2 [Lingula anatina]|uniref:Secretory carrier-associated membrane protein n=1 Tax=Lingula anatina TaxID=7574 RepID=A0A1S3JM52_LINAN|nr:secretory carrier-associated membrane protein 1 isoform X2 [Lingula anatina]XP_013421657.1 secretory carrier-associated membrane protein 1 isoform X2 [Lingula anatina]|eukprot:XP_013411490.1 secretory carrier-associated membrane protein 1 isoform X2 [Lingula anatina]